MGQRLKGIIDTLKQHQATMLGEGSDTPTDSALHQAYKKLVAVHSALVTETATSHTEGKEKRMVQEASALSLKASKAAQAQLDTAKHDPNPSLGESDTSPTLEELAEKTSFHGVAKKDDAKVQGKAHHAVTKDHAKSDPGSK